MANEEVITKSIDEAVTAKLTATLVDEDGVAIAQAALTTLALTLYDKKTGGIINLKNATDINGVNGGSIHATSGLVTLILTPLDTVMVGTKSREPHIALLKWTYNAGAKAGLHVIEHTIKNIVKVL